MTVRRIHWSSSVFATLLLLRVEKKLLANLVVRALTSPLSSVAAERGGSILHNLGSYDRRKMGTQAMQDNMFLRVNKSYIHRLQAIAVNRVRMRAPKVRTTAHVNNHDSGSRIRKLNPSRETQKRKRQNGAGTKRI